MMAYVTGDAITDVVVLRDNTQAAITGVSDSGFATLEAYVSSSPTVVATVSLVEIGDGEYRASFTPSQAGQWTLHVLYDSGGVFREFLESYNVSDSATTTVVTPAVISTSGTTRQTIRRTIADILQDLIVVEATADSDAGVIIDEENLVDSDRSYINSYVRATGGTVSNLGAVRKVLTSTQAQGMITLLSDLPADVTEGDEFELVNLRGIGFRFQEYHRSINDAIRILREGEFLVPMIETLAANFDEDTPTITVPTDMAYVHRVQYKVTNLEPDEWFDIPRARIKDAYGSGWTPVGQTGVIAIQGSWWRNDADGNAVRVWGASRPADLDDDDDVFPGPTEFIVNYACHRLAFKRGGPEWTPRAMLFYQQAQETRPRSTMPWSANMVKVR